MNAFVEGLTAKERGILVPEEMDFWGPLIGEWDFNLVQYQEGREVPTRGEWIFARILEGNGIQDLFICPSRAERNTVIRADAEYGTTIRTYHAEAARWNVVYTYPGEVNVLTAEKAGGEIIMTLEHPREYQMKWIFSEIEENAFKWRHIRSYDNGRTWELRVSLSAVRR